MERLDGAGSARRRPWLLVAGIAAVGLCVALGTLISLEAGRPVEDIIVGAWQLRRKRRVLCFCRRVLSVSA